MKQLINPINRAMTDLTGKIFGRLTVIEITNERYYESVCWLCLCECGNNKIVPSARLIHGKTKSCGCYNLDVLKYRSTTHGETINGVISTEWAIWSKMIDRCTRKTSKSFIDYGGRGITVCEKWKNGFENFLYDMGRRPGKSYSLERVDNDKGYYKENCKWATRKAQAGNRRSNVRLIYLNREMIMQDWANELKKDHSLITYHLKKGKSFEWIYEHFSNKNK